MSINMIPVSIPCEICGGLHTEYAIDGHICVPHICNNCWKRVVNDWQQSPKCVECRRCTYIPEYEVYWCEFLKIPIDLEWRSACCVSFERKTEE